ncbi:UDP-N-acetylmuramoyl-tripeptide--D-alanyl-D-alanine ligase [Roseateles depolymerans]|uniref:UDP-N-acetylmuramoyl-tripeptide--D-alanyl-D-alanine ligase n=1 Tax=Roseateles depolymerans TaxID=76731 RepID=A0A0U2U031_9BURK|nr:Mur ligase family protein [Roseateles depolymerans]ALV05713.1 UDP-N-acetylmuramoyl-tripeptide--D-alanyl-D-alanine ligase [Roseateles depolymerans]REG13017.1 UDP-N-acetylmuramoyl-tripeptide--D-alanyl-D-alanine ligase [Roseateles depolymerans]
MTLGQAHALLQPLLPQVQLLGDAATPIQRVSTDTRQLREGDLFVALRGERFDAHDFLPQARAAGAVAAVAERGLAEAGLPGLLVPDAKQALGLLSQAWRATQHLPVIAVTGSNGKTTVTQMIASILRAWLGDTGMLATEGNFNNEIGVPLTLLRLRQDDAVWHRAAVVELGMNHPGEIAPLAAMAQPTVALVNNAQREHQEFMHTVEAVARENGEVIRALGPAGVAVFPAEDACAPVWHELAAGRGMLTFALQGQADVMGRAQWVPPSDGENVIANDSAHNSANDNSANDTGAGHWALDIHTPAGDIPVRLAMAGQHNLRNALAAAACTLAAGAPRSAIRDGLERFKPVKGRSALQTAVWQGRRITLIDDSYNANPDSVRAAIDVLAELPGSSWLVLGDMGEVGEQGPAFHREVGAHAADQGLAALWTAGAAACDAAAAYGAGARAFDTVDQLIQALNEAPQVQNVLVKGSRFMKMEQIVAALQSGGRGETHAA